LDVEPAAEASPTAMTLRWIDRAGVRVHDSSDFSSLLDRTDDFCWLDIPVWSDYAERLLRDLHCHPLAVKDSKERNHIPRVHLWCCHSKVGSGDRQHKGSCADGFR
jgi:hypothetical protein